MITTTTLTLPFTPTRLILSLVFHAEDSSTAPQWGFSPSLVFFSLLSFSMVLFLQPPLSNWVAPRMMVMMMANPDHICCLCILNLVFWGRRIWSSNWGSLFIKKSFWHREKIGLVLRLWPLTLLRFFLSAAMFFQTGMIKIVAFADLIVGFTKKIESKIEEFKCFFLT